MTPPNAALHCFSSYDGTALAYAELGSGPRLVCLAGGPGRASEYLEDLGGLTSTRTIVRLDARGTGRSSMPDDLSSLRFDRLADDVEVLRGVLDLPRLDLLAHSAGCIVAQAYAARYPERVGALVLVTPSDRLQGGTRDDVPQIRASRRGEPWFEDAQAAEQLAGQPNLSPDERQVFVRRMRPFYYGRWDARIQAHAASAESQSSEVAERYFDSSSRDVDVKGLIAKLRELDIEVLVLAGERDGLTGVAAAETVAESFAHARLEVLPRVGHFPWVDEPDMFRERVAAFLEQAHSS